MEEVIRNYLEIKSLKDLLEVSKPAKKCQVFLVDPVDFQLNKFFYKQIGRKHNWVDRLVWEDKKWIDYHFIPAYLLASNRASLSTIKFSQHTNGRNSSQGYIYNGGFT